jgi:hypothetical protein
MIQINDENARTGHSISTRRNATKTPGRQAFGKASVNKKHRRAFGQPISLNTGRKKSSGIVQKQKNHSSLKPSSISSSTSTSTSSSSSSSKQSRITQNTTLVEDIECISTTTPTTSTPFENYDGGINRKAAMSALQMGVRAAPTHSDALALQEKELQDTQQSVELSVHGNFHDMDSFVGEEIEFVTESTALPSTGASGGGTLQASTGSGIDSTRPTLGDLSFGDISSDDDDSSASDASDVEEE